LNSNNPETAEASQLKLRLLRGSPRRYEPAKSELSGFNRKKSILELSTPTVSRGVGVGRPDLDRSMVLDEGSLWQSMATKTRTADFGGSTSDPAAARSENPTKEGAERAYKKPILR
jgi:hypothetical protein